MKDCAADLEGASSRKSKTNGEAVKILWWLLVTVTGVLITSGWFWISSVMSKINVVEASQVSSVERIARLEEALKGLSKDIAKIDVKVEATNEKLDRLLEYQYRIPKGGR